jgi:hypothetical protein
MMCRSSPQPVTENPIRTLVFGPLRGAPAEVGMPATKAPARGKSERLGSNHHAADFQLSCPVGLFDSEADAADHAEYPVSGVCGWTDSVTS